MTAHGVDDAPFGRFHFEPVARTLARTVGRVQSFRDDALDAVLGARVQRVGDGAAQSRHGAPRRPAQLEPFEQCAAPAIGAGRSPGPRTRARRTQRTSTARAELAPRRAAAVRRSRSAALTGDQFVRQGCRAASLCVLTSRVRLAEDEPGDADPTGRSRRGQPDGDFAGRRVGGRRLHADVRGRRRLHRR
jgi:hypothetical protein